MSIDEEILACEGGLREAQLNGDVEKLDRLLDDELMFTSYDGTLVSKNEDLALHRSGRLKIKRMEPGEYQMLHLGETSIVSVLMKAAAVLDGAPITASIRYTRVWHKRPEGWRVVAGHMSTVPA